MYAESRRRFGHGLGVEPARAGGDISMIESLPIYDIEYLYKAAAEAANAGEDARALEYLERVLNRNSHHAMAWCIKGNCLDNLDRCEEALGSYDRSLHIDPSNSDTWFNKGLTLKKLGRTAEAQQCIRNAVQLALGE
jgi:tetratricopeptide (TPR) repeat protein